MQNRQLEHGDHPPQGQRLPLCLLAHDLDGPLNVGSLFRIADALGVERVYLTGTSPVPPNDRIRRTSRATERHVPFDYQPDPLPLIQGLKAEGYTLVSLEITSASTDIRQPSWQDHGKICLILGSENQGVCQALLDASDLTVHIPMRGHNSSMNVATACAIATFELTRHRP